MKMSSISGHHPPHTCCHSIVGCFLLHIQQLHVRKRIKSNHEIKSVECAEAVTSSFEYFTHFKVIAPSVPHPTVFPNKCVVSFEWHRDHFRWIFYSFVLKDLILLCNKNTNRRSDTPKLKRSRTSGASTTICTEVTAAAAK